MAAAPSLHAQMAPLADHHQHLFSPTVAVAEGVKEIDAAQLISLLDSASIRRAAVLPDAYILGDPKGTAADETTRLKRRTTGPAVMVRLKPDTTYCGSGRKRRCSKPWESA